jgi:NADH:ubiquinone oxidoreductase subunit 3 (subunit A)
MIEILLSPPVAFLLYLVLVAALARLGRLLAGPPHLTSLKSSTYASGEAPPIGPAAPGYRPFFVIALFFAVLHLGVLMLSSGNLAPTSALYMVGLLLAMVALILG